MGALVEQVIGGASENSYCIVILLNVRYCHFIEC